MHAWFYGLTSYSAGLELQKEALGELARGEKVISIIGIEHPPVVTLGVRGRAGEDLLVSKEVLNSKGVELVETNRGGQATLHSPGQLVIYPCVNLRTLKLGPRDFVNLVNTVTTRWLQAMGVNPECQGCEPGLYVSGAKLVAFGFHISHGLTSHGIAINVSNDLSLFDLIRPCGLKGQPMTKLEEVFPERSMTLETLFAAWVHSFWLEIEERGLAPLDEPTDAR